MAGVATASQLYIMGGYITGSSPAGTKNEIYTPSTNEWTTGPNIPTDRNQQPAACLSDGVIFVMGGAELEEFTDVYTVATSAWSTVAAAPTSRWMASCGVVNGNLYLFGGCDPSFQSYGITEVYTIATSSWASGPDMYA